VNAKHRKTLIAILARPTSASIPFADIEALMKALGAPFRSAKARASKSNSKVSSGGAIGHIRERKPSVIKSKKRESFSSV
jgi:hypothetical protein